MPINQPTPDVEELRDRNERMEAALGQWLMYRWEHEDSAMPIPMMIEWALCGDAILAAGEIRE